MNINVWTVLLAAAITASATGLGALPFIFVKDISRWWVGVANAVAAGLMLAASYSLINEGFAISAGRTLGGILVGLVLIVIADKLVERQDFDVAELIPDALKRASGPAVGAAATVAFAALMAFQRFVLKF